MVREYLAGVATMMATSGVFSVPACRWTRRSWAGGTTKAATRSPSAATHLPSAVAHGFAEAAQMAEAYGFRPGANPYDLWGRVD